MNFHWLAVVNAAIARASSSASHSGSGTAAAR